MKEIIEKLSCEHRLSREELLLLLQNRNPETAAGLQQAADLCRREIYGNKVYIRGLVEFTNYCTNNCLYCGLRRENANVQRYRLGQEEILACCAEGWNLGFRTFVLQGGEDPYFTPERVEDLVRALKKQHPDCAVTLSVGEQSREVYALWRKAGADRYLLRHETANDCHYRSLHPAQMRPEERKRCLFDLKSLGYQVGAGMMVGSPGQTLEHLAEDLTFLQELKPQMVGIGPFIPQKDTPLGAEPAGSVEMTLYLLSVVRLLLPPVMLPATTALGSLDPRGREKGILAGANVCMPNLTPLSQRKNYAIYDNKLALGAESAGNLQQLKEGIAAIGFQIVEDRGDYPREGETHV